MVEANRLRQLPSLPLLRLLGFSAAFLPRLRNPRPPENLARGVRRLGFWRAIHDCSSTYAFFLVVIALGTRLLPGDPFMGLHYEYRPAPTVVRDFEQRTISTSANGASDTLGMGPSAGYILISVITVLAFTVFICMSYLHAVAFVSDIHIRIYVITKLLMFYFWIKLTMKMPNSLIIEKPNFM